MSTDPPSSASFTIDQLEAVDQLALTWDMLANPYLFWMARSPKDKGMVAGCATRQKQFIRNALRQDGWHFYVALNQSRHPGPSKPNKQSIDKVHCIGLDFDPVSTVSPDPLLLFDAIEGMEIDPDRFCIVDSGRGLWVWLMCNDFPVDERLDSLIKGVARRAASEVPYPDCGTLDTTCAELSRIARCPGTVNPKTGRRAKFWHIPDGHYLEYHDRADLEEIAEGWEPPAPEPRVGPPPRSLLELLPALNLTSRSFVLYGTSEQRHKRVYSTAKNLHELGVAPALASSLLTQGACMSKVNGRSLNEEEPGFVEYVLKEVWNEGK